MNPCCCNDGEVIVHSPCFLAINILNFSYAISGPTSCQQLTQIGWTLIGTFHEPSLIRQSDGLGDEHLQILIPYPAYRNRKQLNVDNADVIQLIHNENNTYDTVGLLLFQSLIELFQKINFDHELLQGENDNPSSFDIVFDTNHLISLPHLLHHITHDYIFDTSTVHDISYNFLLRFQHIVNCFIN